VRGGNVADGIEDFAAVPDTAPVVDADENIAATPTCTLAPGELVNSRRISSKSDAGTALSTMNCSGSAPAVTQAPKAPARDIAAKVRRRCFISDEQALHSGLPIGRGLRPKGPELLPGISLSPVSRRAAPTGTGSWAPLRGRRFQPRSR
jgi:hypothetical protein